MPATKHTQHAPSTKTECDYLKKRSHIQKSHPKWWTQVIQMENGKKKKWTLTQWEENGCWHLMESCPSRSWTAAGWCQTSCPGCSPARWTPSPLPAHPPRTTPRAPARERSASMFQSVRFQRLTPNFNIKLNSDLRPSWWFTACFKREMFLSYKGLDNCEYVYSGTQRRVHLWFLPREEEMEAAAASQPQPVWKLTFISHAIPPLRAPTPSPTKRSTTLRRGSSTSDLYSPASTPPQSYALLPCTSHPPTPPAPFDDSRLERLDPKGCPPPGHKSHPFVSHCCEPAWFCLFVICLTSQQQITCMSGTGQLKTILRTDTLRVRLQIKFAIFSSPSRLIPDKPVLALTLVPGYWHDRR